MLSLGIICLIFLLTCQSAIAKSQRTKVSGEQLLSKYCAKKGGQCQQANTTCTGLVLASKCPQGGHCCFKTSLDKVRLTGGIDNASGYVQVRKGGKWLYFSRRFPVQPSSLCKEAGIIGGKAVHIYQQTATMGKRKRVKCIDHNRKCKGSDCLLESSCWNYELTHIGCNGDPNIRLWKESLINPQLRWNSKEGLPEIKYMGKWNRMCVLYSALSNLPVLLCKRLGYKHGALITKETTLKGESLRLYDRCHPNASSMADCFGSIPTKVTKCKLPFQLACRNNQIEQAELRLVPVPQVKDNSTGFINIFNNGKWMNVSRNGFSGFDIKWLCDRYFGRDPHARFNVYGASRIQNGIHLGWFGASGLPQTVTPSQMKIKSGDTACLQLRHTCKNIPYLAECFSPREKCKTDELLLLGCKGDPLPKILWENFLKDPKFRLSKTESGLEMFYNNTWQGLCLINHVQADIICREFGDRKGKASLNRVKKRNKDKMLTLIRYATKKNAKFMDITAYPPIKTNCRYQLTCKSKGGEKKRGNVTKTSQKNEVEEKERQRKKAPNMADKARKFVKVDCDSRAFNLTVNVDVFKELYPHLKTGHLNLLDKACSLGKPSDTRILSHSFNLNACGTKQEISGTDLVYSNQLISTNSKEGSTLRIDLRCNITKIVAVTKNVEFVKESHVVITGKGNMFMNIDVYEDSTFKNKITSHKITVPRKTPLYVDIWMKSTDPTLFIGLQDCKAISMEKTPVEVSVIRRGCPSLPNVEYLGWKKHGIRFILPCDNALTNLISMQLQCHITVCSSRKKDETCSMPKCHKAVIGLL